MMKPNLNTDHASRLIVRVALGAGRGALRQRGRPRGRDAPPPHTQTLVRRARTQRS